MFTKDKSKPSIRETFKGQGFSFRIPKGFRSRLEVDQRGEWGYGEFFQSYALEANSIIHTNVFFYYWRRVKNQLSEREALKLVRKVCGEKIFTSEHFLRLLEKIPINFEGHPAFLMKFRFNHHDPKASGPVNFFIINNTNQKKVFILGTLTEQSGDFMLERESLAWIEDEIVSSFRFKKIIGRSP